MSTAFILFLIFCAIIVLFIKFAVPLVFALSIFGLFVIFVMTQPQPR